MNFFRELSSPERLLQADGLSQCAVHQAELESRRRALEAKRREVEMELTELRRAVKGSCCKGPVSCLESKDARMSQNILIPGLNQLFLIYEIRTKGSA